MSFPTLELDPPAAASPVRNGAHLAQELTSLVDEIQRTREWFNTQIEAQLSSLRQLRAAMQSDDPTYRASIATLFEPPHPVLAPEPAASAPMALMAAPLAQAFAPAFAPASQGLAPLHQAVVLPPTHVTTLDPELEQATLRELNDALAKAFSEISSRGGMLG